MVYLEFNLLSLPFWKFSIVGLLLNGFFTIFNKCLNIFFSSQTTGAMKLHVY